MDLKFNRDGLLGQMNAVVDKTMEMDLTWDWPCGVAYYGISRAFEATGNAACLEALKARADEYISLGLPVWTVNTCAMGHALLTLYQQTGEKAYKQVIDNKLEYLQNDAPRFGEQVLQHTVSAKNDFPEQAWADTLFMATYFMLRAGVYFEDTGLVKDALNQYYWHIEYLQDPTTGLWYHGYNHLSEDHMSGFYWGRANAWAAYTMICVRVVLPGPYLYPPFMDIESSLRDQLAALKKLQGPDGLWHTILYDPESYGEVSATAGIAAAMVTGDNPLHTVCAQKALDAVQANISEDGRVLNVSGGTAVIKDREGYRSIPRKWAQGWGQGLALALQAAVPEGTSGGDRQPEKPAKEADAK